MSDPKIAIVGAGIAGIFAARTLYLHGFKNIAIFEASDRIGGRIRSIKHDGGWIELGAQWIHGQQKNILFEYASSKGLLADPQHDYGIEGNGYYCTEEGHLITCPIIKKLINYLDKKKNQMTEAIENKQNVFNYFKKTFDMFVESSNLDSDTKTLNLLKDVFRWFIIFEVIDNSCEELQTLSTLSYTEWENCSSVVDLIHFKENYSSIFDELTREFPFEELLHLRTQVYKIELTSQKNPSDENLKVKLLVSQHNKNSDAKNKLLFDHVIITSSLGFLKENLNSDFFGFDLPEKKSEVIQALGFGTINKVFLYFDKPFWNDEVKGFQILWSHVNDKHSYSNQINNSQYSGLNNFPEWVYCIQGFDLVHNQPKMLMAWIGSYGAKQIEFHTDDEIKQILTNVLRQIVPKSCRIGPIDHPSKIYCSRWYSDPFFRGAYSNRTTMYEKLSYDCEYNIDILAQPILIEDILDCNKTNSKEPKKPLILFAGEATDREHYSTTHGAMRSGQREANRLITFYE